MMDVVQADKPCPQCKSTDVRMIVLDDITLNRYENGYLVEEIMEAETVYLCWPCGFKWDEQRGATIQ